MTADSATPPAGAFLTIIVPTYNRADHLEFLLRNLRDELHGLGHEVTVLVSDNASTDRTPDLTRELQAGWPTLLIQRHEHNLGADGNFCSCVEQVASRYFWIIGDDDCPRPGAIAGLLALLHQDAPPLVYMQSEWVPEISSTDQSERLGTLRIETMDAVEFARRVHVWFTFISGVIVNRAALAQALGGQDLHRFHGTSLAQLGWIFPLLRASGRFAFVHDRCVLATSGNSGGYPLLTVFCVNYPRIVHELFGRSSAIGRALIDGAVTQYLPGLIWWSRTTAVARHDAESPWPAMNEQLGNRFWYWAVLVPMGRFPRPLAQPFRLIWRASNLARRVKARLSRTHA